MFADYKKSFISKLNDKFVTMCPSQLKCLATGLLPCDLSLIIQLQHIVIQGYCQFSDIHIAHGRAATYIGCGEIFKHEFVANLPLSLPVKEL